MDGARGIELITWIDSATLGSGFWINPELIDPNSMTEKGLCQQSVGFLYKESPDAIMIVHTIGSDQIGAALVIPKKAILNRIPMNLSFEEESIATVRDDPR